jgi:hypothetical protein
MANIGKENNDILNGEIEIKSDGGGVKFILSKFEYDLYHEEEDVPLPIIRVKHFGSPSRGAERWKMFADNKLVLTIEGNKLNKRERAFLRGLDGINFLISCYKLGVKSFSALKKEIKMRVKKGT